MNKKIIFVSKLLLLTSLCIKLNTPYAENLPDNIATTPIAIEKPIVKPTPPTINAKAYILIDVNSGKVIANANSDEKLPPASLTKMMTLYVVSSALKNNQIHLTDSVRISENAWRTGGSRMFVKEGQQVSIEDLLKGIIVDSGNDACVAIAEHLGGSEEGFKDIMNAAAKNLSMNNSHFTDSTGLPNPNHYTTAKDLAILGKALINEFPEYYHWYKQKWFSFNDIKQPNRNRLLWRDDNVDGIKTGHTDEAGFCLVASAKQQGMRLLSVVLGAPSDKIRADDSERLLNYGFRFFETHELYKKDSPITTATVYKGTNNNIPLGIIKNGFVTIPKGQYEHLNIYTKVPKYLSAPIKKNEQIGTLIIKLNDEIIETKPLYALSDCQTGNIFKRLKDSIALFLHKWF